jgi:hypothetical protein
MSMSILPVHARHVCTAVQIVSAFNDMAVTTIVRVEVGIGVAIGVGVGVGIGVGV